MTKSFSLGCQIRTQFIQAHARDGRPHGWTRLSRVPTVPAADSQSIFGHPPTRGPACQYGATDAGYLPPILQGGADDPQVKRPFRVVVERAPSSRVHDVHREKRARERAEHCIRRVPEGKCSQPCAFAGISYPV